MNTKLKYIVGMILGALFTIPLASSALSVFTVPQGGTASSSLTGILKGNGKNAIQTATPGTDYVLPSALSSYLSLSSWYATTTDGLDEGLTNLYFTNGRVQTYLSGLDKGYFFSTTSADVWKGSTNFFSTTSSDSWLTTKSTTNVAEGTNLYWTSLRATTSFAQLLAATNTSALAEGTNLYWTTLRGAALLAGTTTDAIAEGATNRYYTTLRFAASLAATTTDALAQGSTNRYFSNALVDTWLGTKSLGVFFSTTSADAWDATKNRWGTTSADFWLTTKSLTAASSTLLTDNNTFSGANQVNKLTFTNATGTNATTTSLAISSVLSSLLKTNATGGVVGASLGTDYVNGSGASGNCVAWGASNALTDAGAPCGSGTGGGASQWATSTLFANMIHTAGAHGLGIGTTTPIGVLSMASSSAVTQWWNHTGASANSRLGYISFANGVFDFGTSSDAGATTSRLTLSQGTSTFNGNALTVGTGSYPSSLVQGVGTSTMWGGINLSNGGCFAVSGVCMGTMALSGSVGQTQYYSGVNTAVGTSSLFIATSQNVGIGTTSPYAKLSVQGTAGLTDAFAVASSTLATMFNVTANGRVGIGSSTPWGTLSIIDSISGSFFPGVITATSTTDLPYFGWTASTSEYAGSAVRIMAGNPSAYMSSADSLDQFLLNGRINTGDWKQMECAHDFNSHTAQIITDITSSVMSVTTGKPCGDFSYIEDANGVADQVVTTGSGYIRLRPGATGATVVAGDGFGLAGTTAFLRHATNTPVYLATVRPGAVQNASTSIYMLGFSAATGVSANYATDAQDGCFFVASSTKANWQAVCRSTTATIVDTGVASSTVTTGDSAWRQFRIDMIGGPTPYAVFRIKQSATASWGPPVATIATTMPTAVSLNPITSVGKVSAGLSPELHINRIRVWYNDPLWY